MPTWIIAVAVVVVVALVLPKLLSPWTQRLMLRSAIRNAQKFVDQLEAEGKHEQAENLRLTLSKMRDMRNLDQVVESTLYSLREQGRHEDASQYEKIVEYARDNMGAEVKLKDQRQSANASRSPSDLER